MNTMILEASTRKDEKNTNLRSIGKVPAVVYGKSVQATSISVDKKSFVKVFQQAGENTVFILKVDGSVSHNVIIRDIQFHSLSGDVEHIDFYAVSMTEKIETMVGIEFVGEAPAVKELGGVLVKNIDELEVRALPGNIPHIFTIDISQLKSFDDVVRVKDLPKEKDVEILLDEETSIVFVSRPREEEAEEVSGTPDVSQVEVEEKGKKEEDSDEKEGEK
jgi:large subunit ribosomal protein L25